VQAAFLRTAFQGTPRPLLISAVLYLLHILLQGSISGSQIALGLSIVSLMFAIAKKQVDLRFHPLYFPLILFIVASVISALFSATRVNSLLDVGEVYSFLAFPLGLALYRSIPRLHRVALSTFLILAIYLSAHGSYQYFVKGYYQSLDFRISGPTAHVMTFSGILLPISLLLLVAMLARPRPILIFATAVSTLALVLTFTRGAWLGWIAGFLTLLLLHRPRWIYWTAPLFVLLLTFSPLAVFGRFASSFNLEHASNLDRVRMLQAGAEIIDDHPIFGVGPTNITELYPLYRKNDAPRFRIPHLHNNVVQIWAERGFLAVVAYGLILYLFAMQCFRARSSPGRRLYAEAGLIALVAISVSGLFEYNFGDTEVQMTMLDLFALVVSRIENSPEGENVLADTGAGVPSA